MATRYYFPETEAAAVSPTISATDWAHINTERRKLLKATPDSSTLTILVYEPDPSDHGGDLNSHLRQFVSDPIGAQTITGNVKAQFQAGEELSTNNLFLTIKVYVVSGDGATVRGTLLAVARDDTEVGSNANPVNRQFASTAVSDVAAQNGDRVVVEVGLGGSPATGSAGQQGHNGAIRFGCDASSGDLPESDAGTGTTSRPWLEFTFDIADAADDITVTPTTATLTLTTFAPTIKHQINIPKAELATATFAPSATVGVRATPETASLTTSLFAPTVLTPRLVTPAAAELVLTTFAPVIGLKVIPITAALATTLFAPTVHVQENLTVTPTTANLVLTTFAPTVATFIMQNIPVILEFASGEVLLVLPDGDVNLGYPSGEVGMILPDGDVLVEVPSGNIELHTRFN